MPFCRKCGRRLAEYSESCPDCGQSTTAPIVNTKRNQSTTNREAKIAKIVTSAAPIIKLVKAKPPKAPAPVKAVTKTVTPVQTAVKKRETVTAAQLNAPIKVAAPPKPDVATKPVLSLKHVVKQKTVKQPPRVAAFSVSFARPVAGLEVPQIKPVSQPKTQKKPVAPAKPVIEPKTETQPVIESAIVQIVAQPQISPQPVPVALETVQPITEAQTELLVVTPAKAPVAYKPKPTTKTLLPPRPMILSEPLAPLTMEPHEIIKSNVSLKKDIISNPNDYEKEPFAFDLRCRNGHFWPEGELLPVSKGMAFCPKCGERLSKPKPKKYRRRQKFP